MAVVKWLSDNVKRQQQITHFIYWGLVMVLLLPSISSWINPNFAAFQPIHGHIYLETVEPNHHDHTFAARLPHNAIPHPHPNQSSEPSLNDIIFLPNDTLQFNLLALCCAPTTNLIQRLDTLGTSLLITNFPIQTISYPPPIPPPRLNLV